ncbi:MAG TPA: FAD-dependent monooxygenase [Methylophilaceae bacterium]
MSTELTRAGIVIIGGGPVGATLALALAANGIASMVLEAREKGASYQDQRALALSYGSRQILHRLGVWQEIAPAATVINTIHISQRGSLGRSILRAEERQQEALGYVVSYGTLARALDQALERYPEADIRHAAEVLEVTPGTSESQIVYRHAGAETHLACELAVLADGGRTLGEIAGLRRETREYGHDALVAKVGAELPHGHVAYERFTPTGPIALLPNGERDFSLVWTGEREMVAGILAMDDATFLHALHENFGDRVGRFLTVGRRMTFPLRLARLEPVVLPHFAVIGNAAQTMHPVAGQGFNVGLRDAWELSQHVCNAVPSAWGAHQVLADYASARQRDTARGLWFTDFLVQIFSNEVIGLSAARSAGLGALDIIRPAKRFLINKMSFGARG